MMLICGLASQAQTLDRGAIPRPDPVRFLPLQRVRALLSASTKEHPHPVRVLFYGQSITQQEWWVTTANFLRTAFPEANLIISNRAIGAFNATYLIRTAELDVYPFRPDLIIFHCYGPYEPGGLWEQLLRQFRQRTTADVILISNHPRVETELNEPTDPALIPTPSEAWLNYIFSEELARELDICFPDTRSGWKGYLKSTGTPLTAVLRDGWHFSLLGSEIQAEMLRPFVDAPQVVPAPDPFRNGRVQTIPVGDGGVSWTGNRLRLEFVGNRVDVVAAPGPQRRIQVKVDGQAPTSLPSGRKHGRSPTWAGEIWGWPALLRVGSRAPLLSEAWALRVSEVDPTNPTRFRFALSGSRTGVDGTGSSTEPFVSMSGRVVIEPGDWMLRLPPGVSQLGSVLVWWTQDHALDEFSPGSLDGVSGPDVFPLFTDLPGGPHVLELIADDGPGPVPIAAFHVYDPAGSVWTVPGETRSTLRLQSDGTAQWAVWPDREPDARIGVQRNLNEPVTRLETEPERGFGVRRLRLPDGESSVFLRLDRP